MFVSVILLWLCVWFVILQFKARRPKNFPPGPPTLPVLGNLLNIKLENPLQDFERVRKVLPFWILLFKCCNTDWIAIIKTEGWNKPSRTGFGSVGAPVSLQLCPFNSSHEHELFAHLERSQLTLQVIIFPTSARGKAVMVQMVSLESPQKIAEQSLHCRVWLCGPYKVRTLPGSPADRSYLFHESVLSDPDSREKTACTHVVYPANTHTHTMLCKIQVIKVSDSWWTVLPSKNLWGFWSMCSKMSCFGGILMHRLFSFELSLVVKKIKSQLLSSIKFSDCYFYTSERKHQKRPGAAAPKTNKIPFQTESLVSELVLF